MTIGRWRLDGTWLRIHDKLYQWVTVVSGREPSPTDAAVDSQSVETATMISQDVGYDAGKKIQSAQTTFDSRFIGFSFARFGNFCEYSGTHCVAKEVLKRVHSTGDQVKRLHTIWMDGGYRGDDFMHARDGCVYG